MFNELDTVALISPIPVKYTRHISEHSPLRETIDSGVGLLPGDVGTIVLVNGAGEAFEVEFVLPDGCPAAIATVYPHQMRPATEEDLANDRFQGKAQDIIRAIPILQELEAEQDDRVGPQTRPGAGLSH